MADNGNFDENAHLEEREKPMEVDLVARTADEQLEKIQKALSLNNKLDAKFYELEKALHDRLQECRQRLAGIQQSQPTSLNQEPGSSQQVFFSGKPYFKDSDGVPAPDNEDTIEIKKMGMYDLSNIKGSPSSSDWTNKDKEDFFNKIQELNRKIRKDQLNANLDRLVLLKQNKKKCTKRLIKNITALKKEIACIGTAIDLPLKQGYDWEAIARELNNKHTPQEYQALWKTFLIKCKHNKNKWDKAEGEKLRGIAIANQLQDWDEIARELGTGRTGYECFVFYRKTNIMPKYGLDKSEVESGNIAGGSEN